MGEAAVAYEQQQEQLKHSTLGSGRAWLSQRKRDWDNAFLEKYNDLEATLHENDNWLSLYTQSMAEINDDRPDMAITRALKTSSARRRGRVHRDVRNVFGQGKGGDYLPPGATQMSPFGTLRVRTIDIGRAPSQDSTHNDNNLSWALSHGPMIPHIPTSLNSGQLLPAIPDTGDEDDGGMETAPETPLPVKPPALYEPLQEHSAGPVQRKATPILTTQSQSHPRTSPMSANRPVHPKFTPTSMPTLRDLLMPPTALQKTPTRPVTNISYDMGSLSIESKKRRTSQSSEEISSSSSVSEQLPNKQSVSSDGEQPTEHVEMTRGEEDVREKLQRVSIEIAQGDHAELSRITEEEEERSTMSNSSVQDDLCDLQKGIEDVEAMIAPSSGDEEEQHKREEKKQQSNASARRLKKDSLFVDVDIDLEPLEVSLDNVGVEKQPDTAKPVMKHPAGIKGKRKHSGDDMPGSSTSAMSGGTARTHLMTPTQSSLARTRSRIATGGSTRKPTLRSQTSSSTVASSGSIRRPPPRVAPNSKIPHPAGPTAATAAPPLSSSSSASAIGHVAATRKRFEGPDGKDVPFKGSVVAMRPGYASIRPTSAMASTAPSAAKPVVAKTKTKKPSLAAMRETGRARAAKTPKGGAASELVFKSVSRPVSALSHRKSKQSLGSKKTSQEQMLNHRPSNSSVRTQDTLSSVDSQRQQLASAIPLPMPRKTPSQHAVGKGKGKDKEAVSSSVESGWGIGSMISMLSPANWKSSSQESVSTQPQQVMPETPTAQPGGPRHNTSPYDMASPQTPYQPRPEHAGGKGSQLVMPKYQDMAVPLRRSSSQMSAVSQDSSSGRSRQSHRISGVSSFRSSFFSVDSSEQDHMAMSFTTPLKDRNYSDEYTSIMPAGSNSPPEIESEYSDEYSDEEFSPAKNKKKKNDFKTPRWATTPELIKGLKQQERVNPDRIFGKVRPIRVEEIFGRKEGEKRKSRNSSMIWTGGDALSAEEELEYIRRMGFEG